jgi:hypothetical protein
LSFGRLIVLLRIEKICPPLASISVLAAPLHWNSTLSISNRSR